MDNLTEVFLTFLAALLSTSTPTFEYTRTVFPYSSYYDQLTLSIPTCILMLTKRCKLTEYFTRSKTYLQEGQYDINYTVPSLSLHRTVCTLFN